MPIGEPKNLNEIPDTAGYLGEGTHDVVITEAIHNEKCITDNGTEYFVLVYSDAEGRTCRDSFYDTEKAYWRWKQLGEACQLTPVQMSQFVPQMAVGNTIRVTLEPQKDKPQYMQVKRLEPTGVIVSPQSSPDKADCPF